MSFKAHYFIIYIIIVFCLIFVCPYNPRPCGCSRPDYGSCVNAAAVDAPRLLCIAMDF